ncbi:MAG TPA: hypothetical protein PLZ51_17010, partial [Aggregatilineales bacterium]|nr:hypothetical protein [Aggregatilineales bacterium]
RNAVNSATSLKLFTEVAGVYGGFVCTSLIDNSGNYARYNWFISTGSGFYPGGECSVSPSGTQNNVATVLTALEPADISAFFSATFFTGVNDADHPYRLRPDALVNATPAYDPNPGLVMDGLIVTGVAGT